MKKTILLALVLALALAVEVAKADFVFGEPTNLGPIINTSSGEGGNGGLSISADGLSLYFDSNRSGGNGVADLWITTRATKNDDWSAPVNLGSVVNSSGQDNSPSISADGLSLYFSSNRSGAVGGSGWSAMDLWVAKRETTAHEWGTPSNLGPVVNSSEADYMSYISADGLSLYFSSDRPGGSGNRDLWVSTRATTDDEWSEPVNLGPTINTPSNERRMWISSEGLMLLFQSDRPKGSGAVDIYMTTRAMTNDDWTEPVNIGPPVNVSIISDVSPVVSSDGCGLYFASYARIGNYGAWDLWQAPIEPICDLNADGIVDAHETAVRLRGSARLGEYALDTLDVDANVQRRGDGPHTVDLTAAVVGGVLGEQTPVVLRTLAEITTAPAIQPRQTPALRLSALTTAKAQPA